MSEFDVTRGGSTAVLIGTLRPMTRPITLLAALLLVACSEAPTVATGDDFTGDYPLRSINGFTPPQIIDQDDTGVLSIVGGLVRLNADKTFMDSTLLQLVTADAVQTEADVARGTWRVTADSIFFLVSFTEYGMARAGLELTQEFDGHILVYRK